MLKVGKKDFFVRLRFTLMKSLRNCFYDFYEKLNLEESNKANREKCTFEMIVHAVFK